MLFCFSYCTSNISTLLTRNRLHAAADRLMATLILGTLRCSFHFSLSIQHKDYLICFLSLALVVFSYERNPFLHKKHDAPHMKLYFKYIYYRCTNTVVETTNLSNYNPSILVICILKVNHHI